MEINLQIAINGFFEGCEGVDDIDELGTIDAYASACEKALTVAYPEAEITVEVSSNRLSDDLRVYDDDGNPDDGLKFFVESVLYNVWNDGTFLVEKALVGG